MLITSLPLFQISTHSPPGHVALSSLGQGLAIISVISRSLSTYVGPLLAPEFALPGVFPVESAKSSVSVAPGTFEVFISAAVVVTV